MEQPIKGKLGSYAFWDMFEKAKDMINKSVVIYGQSGHGKSFITNTYLSAVSPYIQLMIAFSPTASTDSEFPLTKYTPSLFIHETLDMAAVARIMSIGTDKKKVCEQINDVDNLYNTVKNFIIPFYNGRNESKLYAKTTKAFRKIKRLHNKLEDEDTTLNEKEDIKRQLIRYYRVLLYNCKKYIRDNKIVIPEQYKEHYSTIYWSDLRPRTLVLFNDLGNDINDLKGKDRKLFNDLYSRERHSELTVITLMQNMTQMDKKARQNAKINIFVTASSALQYVEQTNPSKNLRARMADAVAHIIDPDKAKAHDERKFYLLLYDSLNDKIYYTKANNKISADYVGNKNIYDLLKEHEVDSRVVNNMLLDNWKP